ncbi:MAG: hypothetical protein O2999_04255 [Nitrospirae bacterium]|nr:hypothetical protein [Nitrospirota bacterium]MDA1303501.1 hypothetical protein [Nitrospirota bacterium]
MARFTLDEFLDRGPELIYISGNLVDAEHVESALGGNEIDYAMNIENYENNSFLGGTYPGVFFYVSNHDAQRSRECLHACGLTDTIAPE